MESMAIAAQNIALVGFRATGKSTLGRILAEKLGYTFVDMDEELVTRFGTDIHNWVQEHGWEAFRDAEAQLFAELAGHLRQIVATVNAQSKLAIVEEAHVPFDAIYSFCGHL